MKSELTRRDFLAGGTGIAFAGLGSGAWAEHPVQAAPKRAMNWKDVRGQFNLDPRFIHMAGLLLTSHPKPVRDEIEKIRNRLDANPTIEYDGNEKSGERDAREAAARYIGAKQGEIALTDSTTQALAVLYNGITVRPDQEIVSTKHDHHSTIVTLSLRAQRMGTKLRSIELYKVGAPTSREEISARLAAELRPETRVVAVTWVHSSTGYRMPIELFAEVVRKANQGRSEDDRILLCVDGVHGFGVEHCDMKTLGCDFFAAGCHKWMFGPRGTGILYGNPEVSKFVKPCIVTFSEFDTWGQVLTPGGFHSFEHRWALPKAFEFHEQIGRTRIRERIHDLARQAKEGLAKMPNVKLYTPLSDDLSAALICFDVVGKKQVQVMDHLFLKRNIISSVTPYSISYARLTPGLWNDPEEVDRTLEAIREISK